MIALKNMCVIQKNKNLYNYLFRIVNFMFKSHSMLELVFIFIDTTSIIQLNFRGN